MFKLFLPDAQGTDNSLNRDRGLLYGAGVFTTLAAYQRQLLCWDEHWRRLNAGCQSLAIPLPPEREIKQGLLDLCQVSPSVLKCLITQGCGGRGYAPPAEITPNVLLSAHPWPEWPVHYAREGVRVRIGKMRLGRNPALAGIKHISRLEQVIARTEWSDPEISEALLLDSEGNVIEGTMSNLFFFRNGTLCTPDLQYCGVRGVMRDLVLQAAAFLGIKTESAEYSVEALMAAEEIFLCNSIIGVWPVCQIGASVYSTGPLTRRIQMYLEKNGRTVPYV